MIKGAQVIAGIPAHGDIGKVAYFQFIVKLFDEPVVNRRGHHDLDLFKQVDMGDEFFGLVYAMLTIRTEDHDHRCLLL